MKDCCLMYAYFSTISKNTIITKHSGVSNLKLRVQIPLFVNKKSIIIVDGVRKIYKEGDSFIFDDTFQHEVQYLKGDNDRVVLIFDIFHPELTKNEIKAIKILLK